MTNKPFAEIGNYTTFPNEIIDHIMPKCKPNTWKVVCITVRKTIGWHKDEDQISLSQYMKLTGIVGRSTLSQALQDAVTQGYLIKTEGPTNSYAINRDYEIEGSPISVPASSPKTVPPPSPKTGHTKERSLNKVKKKKEGAIPEKINTPDFQKSWTDFQEHRKQSKKPMTQLARSRMLTKLSKYPVRVAIQMLEQSIENGWQGVFDIKGRNGSTPPRKYDKLPDRPAVVNSDQVKGLRGR